MANLTITTKKSVGAGTTAGIAGIVGATLEAVANNSGIETPTGTITIVSTALITAIYKAVSNWLKHRGEK